MRTAAVTVLTVALELLLGAAIFAGGAAIIAGTALRAGPAGRRRLVAWARAGRTLLTLLPVAVVLLATASALLVAAGPFPVEHPARIWVHPLPFAATGALGVGGCILVLQAGRREARGRWREARRQARFGGAAVLFGVVAQLIVVWTDLLFDVQFRRAALSESRPALLLALAMLALGVAAFAALVAGLAGKPRPTGELAAALYLLGLAGLAAVAQAG